MIEITAEIRAFIDKAAAGAELAEDEYIDLSDGLIHCKKSLTQTSTQNIGRNIFTAMGVYRDARKDFVWQKDFPALSATLNGSKKKSANISSS